MGGRRGPLIAGIAVAAVLVLVAVVLVLPKLGQVKDANDSLAKAQSEEATLNSQLAALKQAEQEAPKNNETIRKVQEAIPPTADQQGFILLLQNAAVDSGVDLFTITAANPVYDPATGLSTISNAVTVNGTYFAITEFLFNVETLPRASKVTDVTLAPGGSVGELSLQASIDTFTSDSSAGPGSSPGPTSGSTGTTGSTATTPPTTQSPAAEIATGA